MTEHLQADLMEVIEVRQQTAGREVRAQSASRTSGRAKDFSFRVGQFGMFSAFGYGESTFNICSSSNWKDFIEFCFRKTGKVTEALWQAGGGRHHRLPRALRQRLSDGDVGGQEPDLHRRRDRHAADPLRHLVRPGEPRRLRRHHHRLRRAHGRRPGLSPTNWTEWAEHDRVRVIRCVDPGGETPDWKGEIGFVPARPRAGQHSRRQRRRPGHRPADHDQVHPAGAGQDGPARTATSTPAWRTA